jgi:hypothetical protein
MEILGIKWQNGKKRGTGLTISENLGKPTNTGVLRGADANTK